MNQEGQRGEKKLLKHKESKISVCVCGRAGLRSGGSGNGPKQHTIMFLNHSLHHTTRHWFIFSDWGMQGHEKLQTDH